MMRKRRAGRGGETERQVSFPIDISKTVDVTAIKLTLLEIVHETRFPMVLVPSRYDQACGNGSVRAERLKSGENCRFQCHFWRQITTGRVIVDR